MIKKMAKGNANIDMEIFMKVYNLLIYYKNQVNGRTINEMEEGNANMNTEIFMKV